MLSFFRKNKPDPKPEWAELFTDSEYQQFLAGLSSYFEKEKTSYTIADGEITTEGNGFGGVSLGLFNLAQMCKQTNKKKWRDIIFSHFNGLKEAAVFEKEFSGKVHSYDYAKDFLAVRIYNAGYLASLDSSVSIGKNLGEDLFAMLAFDLPTTVTNVKPEQTIQWNKNNEELFEIGLDNIRANYETGIEQMELGDLKIWIVQGEHFFVPNIVFDLHNYPQLIGSKGALVGIPHRHLVIIYPINDIGVVTAVSQLIPMISHIHKEGPGSISDSLYWYTEGDIIRLPYKMTDDKLEFKPPETFLNAIGAYDT